MLPSTGVPRASKETKCGCTLLEHIPFVARQVDATRTAQHFDAQNRKHLLGILYNKRTVLKIMPLFCMVAVSRLRTMIC